MSPAALIERATNAEVATVARDDAERNAARKMLDKALAMGPYTESEIDASLTVPPGKQYFESTLVRFLRARKGNEDAGAKMIIEAMNFRRKHDVDNLLSQPLAANVLEHIHKGVYEGLLPTFDKFGRPVYCLEGGQSNKAIGTLLKPPLGFAHWSVHELEDFWMHWHLIMSEYLTKHLFARATERAGHLVNKYVIVDDLRGFSLVGLRGLMSVMGYFKKQAAVDQLLYPETLAVMMFINSPAVFRGPWKVISGFVDRDTVSKVFVLSGPSQYGPAADVLFDKANVPHFLGGTLAGNHVTSFEAPQTVVFGEIDKLVAESGEAIGFDTAKRCAPFTVLPIGSGKVETVSLSVGAGDMVEWQFMVESHDVAYVARFENAQIDAEDKVDSSGMGHQHRFVATSSGTVQLEFSNKHSRMRSKTVRFRLYSWKPAGARATVSGASAAVQAG